MAISLHVVTLLLTPFHSQPSGCSIAYREPKSNVKLHQSFLLQLILALCNVNPGGNKGVEGGKNSLYLLGINQIERMINKCSFLLQYFKNSVNILPPSSLSQPRCKGLKLDS